MSLLKPKLFKSLLVKGFLLLLISASQHANAQLPRISVKGNMLLTPEGKQVLFNGFNTSDPDKLEKSGHLNEAFFAQIKSWGANLVRFPVHPTAWRERGPKAYMELLDKGIKLAEQQGLYVIIDWHSIGNLRTEMFFLDMYDTTLKETYDFWRKMAVRYGNNGTVAFFEFFNEPTIINEQLGTCSWEQWREIMEELIVITRANGAKNIPLIAGFNWGYDLTPVKDQAIRAEGVAYVSHPYPQKREKPWEDKWEKDFGYVADKYPVVLTEIGFCGPDDRGAHIPVISDESYGEAITAYCKKKNMSYVVWVFDANWAPPMFESWDTYAPTRQGKFWKKHLTGK